MLRRNGSMLAAVAALVLLLNPEGALAHPHGTVQCGLAADFKDGQPRLLKGRLLFDQAHSTQALAVLRDPATQKLDEGLQVRFLFGLRQQLARWNWLLAATSDGNSADLSEASSPTLWWSPDGRLGLAVEMLVTQKVAAPLGATWTFSCQDPSRYWISEFLQPESGITLTGCAKPVALPATKVATGPMAGTANADAQCTP